MVCIVQTIIIHEGCSSPLSIKGANMLIFLGCLLVAVWVGVLYFVLTPILTLFVDPETAEMVAVQIAICSPFVIAGIVLLWDMFHTEKTPGEKQYRRRQKR